MGCLRILLRPVLLPCAAALLVACGSAPRTGSPGTGPSVTSTRPTLSAQQASDLAIHALGLVGTPYRYGGNTPEGGFDCSGLINYVYRSRAGVAPPRTVSQLSAFGGAIDAGELRTGDLVLFGRGTPWHAGIYVGQGRFVHAPSTGGTVRLDRLDSTYWSRQATQYRRP
ncbi:C40 family peptidase [Comamonadaceae bacterium PP-2]